MSFLLAIILAFNTPCATEDSYNCRFHNVVTIGSESAYVVIDLR
jgi:hypothetical protein